MQENILKLKNKSVFGTELPNPKRRELPKSKNQVGVDRENIQVCMDKIKG